MTNAYRLSLGVAVTALLVGCSESEPATNAAANTANVAVAAEPAAPIVDTAVPATTSVAAGGAVTADYMVGKWSAMDENCADTLEFRKDGSVKTPFGDAKWSLAGDQLAVDFGDGSKQDPSTIKVLSADRIEITKKSGGKETQKRC